ncbi:beta-galactosidase BglY [Abditibacteriota bacterium]|nr:beta-galactosidase BglY [Abditibacteriota bacterium]
MTENFREKIWHGADYNPEQWLETPSILEEDLRLMRLSHLSSASIGIFSWAMLEPHEGEFHFEWLDSVIENLSKNEQKFVLATPSGAKPHWMALRYPEIRRVTSGGQREAQKARHNHCPTSPLYREKVAIIDEKLARRYGNHPALLAWHISNEFGGDCHCDLCFGAFQNWLRERYNDDLDTLNRNYWSRFWSHSYSSWEEINFIDAPVHGLDLDWRRFMTHQTVDFMNHEIAAIRPHSQVPATTNMMGDFTGLDYAQFAPHLDFICWDAYPQWGNGDFLGDESEVGLWAAFHHDMFRSMKGLPFWLMECSPAQTNWRPVSKLKAPGVHRLSALQTLAHGGDAVMYFQWRQSRGSSEKFHGAVVSHQGNENTRVFGEVSVLGSELEDLSALAGARTAARVAVIYDFENLWAIYDEQGPRNEGKNPEKTSRDFYKPFWKRGISVDVVPSTADFSPYQLIVAPMLYMLRPGVAEQLTEWVRAGGTLVTTYWSGLADENDLCFLGGFPGPLREVLGIWVEETDALHPHQTNSVHIEDPTLQMEGAFEARDYCDLIHTETAHILATYEKDFYAGRAAVTVNKFGAGRAFYIAARLETSFQDQFLAHLSADLQLPSALNTQLPAGVVAQKREGNGFEWVFVSNFNGSQQSFTTSQSGFERLENRAWSPLDTSATQILTPYDTAILRRAL